MTVRTILTEPNSILRQVSKPVEEVGNAERELMEDMLETMYATPNGMGLAAIQIGVPKRIIVLDIPQEENKKILCILLIRLSKIKVQTSLHMKKVVFQYQIYL